MLCVGFLAEKTLHHQSVQAKTQIIHVQHQPVLVLANKDDCTIGVYIFNLLSKLLSHLFKQTKLKTEMTK